MGNSQTLSCTSGEKSSKAQRKEEQYTKAPVDKVKENGANGEPPAAVESPEQKTETTEEPKVESAEEPKVAEADNPAEDAKDAKPG